MPGSSRTIRESSEPPRISRRRRLVRGADEDVGRAALVGDAADRRDQVVAFLLEEVDAEHAREPPERGQLGRLLRRGLATRRGGPRAASISAPSRWAERQARRRIRCDFGCGSTSASTRSATACWLSGSRDGGLPPRFDVFGDFSQGELAQRAEVLEPEEVDQRDVGSLLRVDLAGFEALLQRFGREVDEHDLVGLVEDVVGEGLADADLGQLEDRVVEALEVLDVDRRDDVDAGGEDLVDVLVALLVAHPRRVRVRELVDERELGLARDHRVDVHLVELEAAVAARSRGTTSSPSASAAVSGRSCGSR